LLLLLAEQPRKYRADPAVARIAMKNRWCQYWNISIFEHFDRRRDDNEVEILGQHRRDRKRQRRDGVGAGQ
jgi:hypothetical protein